MKLIITCVLSLLTISFYYATVQGQLLNKFTEEQRDLARSDIYDCVAQENISNEVAEAFLKGHATGVDSKTKCFAKCVLELAGFLKDGKPQPIVMKEKLSPSIPLDILTPIMTLCYGQQGNDNCETGYEILKCFIEEYGPIM